MKSRKRQSGTDIAELSSAAEDVARSLEKDGSILGLRMQATAKKRRGRDIALHHLYPMSRMVLAMRNHSDLSCCSKHTMRILTPRKAICSDDFLMGER